MNTQKSSLSKKLGMTFSKLNQPSVVVALICFFFLGYFVAAILSGVPAGPGAIALEAIFGGFFAACVSFIIIPFIQSAFMQVGRFGYAANFLRSKLEEGEKLVIIAGDLDWVEHEDYKKVIKAFSKRKGKNIHVLCFDPNNLSSIPRIKPKDLRDRIKILYDNGLKKGSLNYHNRHYRGLLLHDVFAIRTEATDLPFYLSWWLDKRRKKYNLKRADYMTYHKERGLLDAIQKMVEDYCEIAPPKSRTKKTIK